MHMPIWCMKLNLWCGCITRTTHNGQHNFNAKTLGSTKIHPYPNRSSLCMISLEGTDSRLNRALYLKYIPSEIELQPLASWGERWWKIVFSTPKGPGRTPTCFLSDLLCHSLVSLSSVSLYCHSLVSLSQVSLSSYTLLSVTLLCQSVAFNQSFGFLLIRQTTVLNFYH